MHIIPIYFLSVLVFSRMSSSLDGASTSPTRVRQMKDLQIAGFTQEIMQNVKLSSIIANYIEVPPSSRQQQQHVCLCPFHDDTNPSLQVSDAKGLYHCFSCKASGNAINFVKEIEKVLFIARELTSLL